MDDTDEAFGQMVLALEQPGYYIVRRHIDGQPSCADFDA
jgi:hypothetical protein